MRTIRRVSFNNFHCNSQWLYHVLDNKCSTEKEHTTKMLFRFVGNISYEFMNDFSHNSMWCWDVKWFVGEKEYIRCRWANHAIYPLDDEPEIGHFIVETRTQKYSRFLRKILVQKKFWFQCSLNFGGSIYLVSYDVCIYSILLGPHKFLI